MKRHKKLVLLSHCILNQNAVVYPLARAKGGFTKVVFDYMKQDYGIYQLPCPELKYLDLYREPMTKDDYNTKVYKQLCEKLTDEVMNDLKKYKDYGNIIFFLHGIKESPTCSISGNRGHFMELLIAQLELNDFKLNYREIAADYEE